MTQLERTSGQTRHFAMGAFAAGTVALLALVALSWHATSGRIAALETQLQELADTLDRRMAAGDWREELGRTTERLESRVDDLAVDLDARVTELAATVATFTSTLEERELRGEALAPATGDVAASERAPDPAPVEVSGLEQEELFEETFESMRDSLELGQERWAEVEWDLERILESLWPAYVALSKSRNPDTAGLRRRYCARVERVLAPEEAVKLGCGEAVGEVTDLMQSPAAGTAP